MPILASYFNITVDRLIGYEPQMEREDIRKLYRKLADDFAGEPFNKVYSECEEYLRKYFSCWELQVQLGLLLINHANLSGSPERMKEILEEVLNIFIRIEKSSGDVNLAKQAIQYQAICYLTLQQPAEAIDILEGIKEPLMQTETMLVRAYQMKGDTAKAIEHLQGYTYVNLITMLGAAQDFFLMYADQPDKMEQYYQIFTKVCQLFEMEELHPAVLLQINFAAAQSFILQGKKDKAMDALERYTELICKWGKREVTAAWKRDF